MVGTELIPVNLITGFLGSGKTTLLSRLLRQPAFADTAVLINELGEIGLDHLLLETLDENIVLLQSGCVCCTIRDDLAQAVRGLYSRRERGVIPAFRRLAIETTGLADPAPIVSTLLADPVLRHHFRLGNIIVTVDAVNGGRQLDRQSESVKQAAIADRIVLTKTDLAPPAAVAALKARLARLNPACPLIEGASADLDAERLLAQDFVAQASRNAEAGAWLAAPLPEDRTRTGHDSSRHDEHIHAVALTFATPLDWTAFGVWLTMLLQAHGEEVLRVKGLLHLRGAATPVAIHGVQHMVHAPVHLSGWPDADRRSRLVFILRDLDPAAVERSLVAFLALGAATGALAEGLLPDAH